MSFVAEKHPAGGMPTPLPPPPGNPEDPLKKPRKYLRRRRCCCLSCCGCCILITVITLLVVAAALLIFFLVARKPEIKLLGVEAPSDGLPRFAQADGGFVMNMNLLFNVNNPNYIGADLESIDGVGYWPTLPDIPFGNGTLKDLRIPSRSNTTFLFPVTVRYDTTKDPQLIIPQELAQKCGFTGKKEQLKINYSVTVKVRVLAVVTVTPSFDDSASFDCPVPDLSSLLSTGLGTLVGTLSAIL
ncbi:hypothetical protein H4R33_000733 [Dimargaris cristalligena]|uniref:Late embryogenesis abundant protein LEA-2 subgroup domain-containing protein n=1 Tax=Dimargaris cristalligena TaxID=215637 RepID=A0A4P9ZZA1_9FUNG|nr:hypothetical protein H4R33_000733 [Dimargaris cristalligena]RKP39096.1 hypothetical protein BJ085DRAFT_31321 [Dimargaris cristalligena]|eukprot:RKP39096.1 hypothetical protein BJ085DRAFT_31321 [Dimargaris cristalligena]